MDLSAFDKKCSGYVLSVYSAISDLAGVHDVELSLIPSYSVTAWESRVLYTS